MPCDVAYSMPPYLVLNISATKEKDKRASDEEMEKEWRGGRVKRKWD